MASLLKHNKQYVLVDIKPVHWSPYKNLRATKKFFVNVVSWTHTGFFHQYQVLLSSPKLCIIDNLILHNLILCIYDSDYIIAYILLVSLKYAQWHLYKLDLNQVYKYTFYFQVCYQHCFHFVHQLISILSFYSNLLDQ